jgi:hypothetical protein
VLLTENFESATPSGTTISNANTSLDSVSISATATLASDSTHAAHGTLSCKTATGGTAGGSRGIWGASLVYSGTTLWYRQYLYWTANPAAETRILSIAPASSTNGEVSVSTAGKLIVRQSTGSLITNMTSTASIPLNAWFRIEGFVLQSATVGQVELKLFTTSMDATSPDETDTSAATQNTNASPATQVLFGVSGSSLANVGPFWQDDIAVSDSGYIGPVITGTNASAGLAAATTVPPGPAGKVAMNMTIQGV